MNFQAVRAIYAFEMARFFRTLLQSFLSPVLSTCLYFVVFGTAIGSRMEAVDGVEYGAFIVPGLIMLSVMTQSISNASFAIYLLLSRFWSQAPYIRPLHLLVLSCSKPHAAQHLTE